ncbi:hypothetical protein HY945_05815, partial [Candidatus Gottesmanbacteria bacterium]|nr:hypothetical protein [Candidatus Gottesmanbacteria bacterium]
MKSYLSGLIGSLGLISFYFITMRLLAGSWASAFSQFKQLWYFMLPLSLGFGIQVGLYTNLRSKMKNNTSKGMMAGSTATSTLGMIACCAHHLTDILPIIGLSAVSVFLINYQIPLLVIGILSNIIGIL